MSELLSALISAGVVGGVCELRLLGWFVVLRRDNLDLQGGGAGGGEWSRAYGVHMDGG